MTLPLRPPRPPQSLCPSVPLSLASANTNPFRTERVERLIRYRFTDGEDGWPRLMARLETLGHRAAIIGPEGSGKTTLLEDLWPRLEERGFRVHWLGLRGDRRGPSPDQWQRVTDQRSAADAWLVDGADLLRPLAWRRLKRLTRTAGALIVTSHARAILPPLLHTRTTPELLRAIVAALVESSIDDPLATARSFFDRHGGNLRLALREMYDREAGTEGLRD